MKPGLQMLWIAAVLLLLTGCGDRIDLEDITLTLTVGIDLDEQDHLLIYSDSPVFSSEAKKKTEEYGVRSTTLRYARSEIDAVVTALTMKGKAQVVLIGKKVLQHEEWLPVLDVLYRDAKSTLNAKVTMTDGPVSEYIHYQRGDKPRMPLHLTKLIETADRRNITLKTSLAQLHTQFFEKGLTPAFTELKMDPSLEVAGTALLSANGKYEDTLLLHESGLLRLLQDSKKGQLSLTIAVPWIKDNLFHRNRMSFYVDNPHRTIKTGYKDGRFTFLLMLDISALQTERLFPYDKNRDVGKLEQAIKQQLEKECRGIVKRLQKHKIDPIGLGMYARAYEYKAWKQVQEHWGEAMAEADIDVQFKVKVLNRGLVR